MFFNTGNNLDMYKNAIKTCCTFVFFLSADSIYCEHVSGTVVIELNTSEFRTTYLINILSSLTVHNSQPLGRKKQTWVTKSQCYCVPNILSHLLILDAHKHNMLFIYIYIYIYIMPIFIT